MPVPPVEAGRVVGGNRMPLSESAFGNPLVINGINNKLPIPELTRLIVSARRGSLELNSPPYNIKIFGIKFGGGDEDSGQEGSTPPIGEEVIISYTDQVSASRNEMEQKMIRLRGLQPDQLGYWPLKEEVDRLRAQHKGIEIDFSTERYKSIRRNNPNLTNEEVRQQAALDELDLRLRSDPSYNPSGRDPQHPSELTAEEVQNQKRKGFRFW